MTSWHENAFHIIGHLWGESIRFWWIPLTKGQWSGALMYSLSLTCIIQAIEKTIKFLEFSDVQYSFDVIAMSNLINKGLIYHWIHKPVSQYLWLTKLYTNNKGRHTSLQNIRYHQGSQNGHYSTHESSLSLTCINVNPSMDRQLQAL